MTIEAGCQALITVVLPWRAINTIRAAQKKAQQGKVLVSGKRMGFEVKGSVKELAELGIVKQGDPRGLMGSLRQAGVRTVSGTLWKIPGGLEGISVKTAVNAKIASLMAKQLVKNRKLLFATIYDKDSNPHTATSADELFNRERKPGVKRVLNEEHDTPVRYTKGFAEWIEYYTNGSVQDVKVLPELEQISLYREYLRAKDGPYGQPEELIDIKDTNNPPDVKSDKIPGGLADDAKEDDFDPFELGVGMCIETEHTDDPDTAEEIARDHLEENPDYYEKLLWGEDSPEASKGDKDSEVSECACQRKSFHVITPDEANPDPKQTKDIGEFWNRYESQFDKPQGKGRSPHDMSHTDRDMFSSRSARRTSLVKALHDIWDGMAEEFGESMDVSEFDPREIHEMVGDCVGTILIGKNLTDWTNLDNEGQLATLLEAFPLNAQYSLRKQVNHQENPQRGASREACDCQKKPIDPCEEDNSFSNVFEDMLMGSGNHGGEEAEVLIVGI